jgi:hypothetical protein
MKFLKFELFQYVRECLNNGKIPNFRLEKLENVNKLLPKDTNSLKLFIEKGLIKSFKIENLFI